jgi:hypothetical protein
MADNEEQTKFHPAVELMLRRMESFPDEFKRGSYRWTNVVDSIENHGTKAEAAAISHARSRIFMDEIHEEAMNELCNGDTRQKANHNPNKRKKESSGDLPTDRRLV